MKLPVELQSVRGKVELVEDADHTVLLYLDGMLIARFSQTGVDVQNMLEAAKRYSKN